MKHIIYFGSDPDFFKELRGYVEVNGIGEFKLEQELYNKGTITKKCSVAQPQIIFVDFTNNLNTKNLLDEIIFTKRIEATKSILYIGLFADTVAFEANRSLITSGFQLFFIKGEETETLFRDCFYIAFDDDPGFPAFAKAKINKKPITAKACSIISSIGSDTFTLETDLEWSEELISCQLPMFPELECKEFRLKEANHSCLQYPMSFSYSVELPVAGPWEELSKASIQKDTLDTWRCLHEELQVEGPIYIKVFTHNRKLFHDIFVNIDLDKYHVTFHDDVNVELIQNDFQARKHPIVFYDLEINPEEEKEEDCLEKLQCLTVSANTGAGRPIIISTQNPSKTQAMQKLLGYSNILSYEKELTEVIFFSILNNYSQKKQPEDQDRFYLNPRYSLNSVDVEFPVELTSLTEHEITFYSVPNLPMFSILKFNLIVPFYATIVPSLIDLPNKSESMQYMAFIYGLDDKSMAKLRKFINQIIYNPPEDFNQETLEKVMSTKIAPPVNTNAPVEKLASKKSEPSSTQIKRKRFQGNSKL